MIFLKKSITVFFLSFITFYFLKRLSLVPRKPLKKPPSQEAGVGSQQRTITMLEKSS